MDAHLRSWHRKPPSYSRNRAKVPRMVTVPVRYAGSNRYRCTSAATRIQRVVRGFLVRKNVNKITAVRHAVCDIEGKISQAEFIESIRSDARERLKVNETLMNALLKLDSVRGVDSSVRDLRKTVIKKAIALQDMMEEAIDFDDQTLDSSCKSSEIRDELDKDADGGSTLNSPTIKGDEPISVINCNCAENELPQSVECRIDADFMENDNADAVELRSPVSVNHLKENESESASVAEAKPIPNEIELELDDAPGDAQGSHGEASPNESQVGSSCSPRCAMEEDEEIGRDGGGGVSGNHGTMMGLYLPDEVAKNSQEEKPCFAEGDDEDGKNREMLRKMLEDNERMMTLMAELLEKSVTQTQFLNSLSKRVELLESALTLDRSSRSRRRKKKAGGRGFL